MNHSRLVQRLKETGCKNIFKMWPSISATREPLGRRGRLLAWGRSPWPLFRCIAKRPSKVLEIVRPHWDGGQRTYLVPLSSL